MTLIEFIKTNLKKGTEIGRLCRDIQGDKRFPITESEERMFSYISFMTNMQGNAIAFKKFTKEFEKQSTVSIDPLDLNARFALLRPENWEFYKTNFPVNQVILKGAQEDYYKAYCLDTSAKRALFFDLKSRRQNLNDLPIMEPSRIVTGNLTSSVTVSEAISLLKNCHYNSQVTKPNKIIFDGLMELLQLNI